MNEEKNKGNKEKKTLIFTDGASKGNPGPGGWGAVLISGTLVSELGAREEDTTNNRMELRALVEAFREIPDFSGAVEVYTDSSYAVNGITKWVLGWKKNNWQTKGKTDVLNRDLWEELARFTEGKKIEWNIVGGHVGLAGNERVDRIASDFAENKEVEFYSGDVVDYKVDILNFSKDSIKEAKKREKRDRSKIKAYSYLSLVDGEFRRHETWVECEACVKGKAGAKYRKAISAEDEKEIMKEWGVKTGKTEE